MRAAVRKLRADLPLLRRREKDFPKRVRACTDAGEGFLERKNKQKMRFSVGPAEVVVWLHRQDAAIGGDQQLRSDAGAERPERRDGSFGRYGKEMGETMFLR